MYNASNMRNHLTLFVASFLILGSVSYACPSHTSHDKHDCKPTTDQPVTADETDWKDCKPVTPPNPAPSPTPQPIPVTPPPIVPTPVTPSISEPQAVNPDANIPTFEGK